MEKGHAEVGMNPESLTNRATPRGKYANNSLGTLLLSQDEVEDLLDISRVLEVVENSFQLETLGQVIMPAKIYLTLPQRNGDFRAMPAYLDNIAGLKWVSVYPNNRDIKLPSVMAIIILCDPNTGWPLAIMDGTHITDMRTGAAGAVAAKYLARKDSKTVGLIGAGRQADTQMRAISIVFTEIEKVFVFDKSTDASADYASRMRVKIGKPVIPVNSIEEAANADIIITTTPSCTPLLKKNDVKKGTHINAIGADAKGKQELYPDLLATSKIVVDNIEQASHSGEVNVPIQKGELSISDIHATLGEIIVGKKKGRESESEITVFDSTGLAIQDVACAKIVYDQARKKNLTTFNFINRRQLPYGR